MTEQVKLEVGKQYKTRGGWRCVVVDVDEFDNFVVWHKPKNKLHGVFDSIEQEHQKNGKAIGGLVSGCDRDIISEWVEPKTYEVWVGLGEHGCPYASTDRDTLHSYGARKIAIKKITITEGEFDE